MEVCDLSPSSTILVPDSCSAWLKCPSKPGAKDMDEGACVFGLYFNKETGRCDYKENVECPFENKEENLCANQPDGTFLADRTECQAYIYCKDGMELRSTCPSTLVFNPITKACVYSNQYKCPEFKTKPAADPLCSLLKNATFVADKTDCTKFGQCIEGALMTHACGEGKAWDYIDQECVDIDSVKCYPSAIKPEPELKVCVGKEGPISDEVSCSGYYFCKKMFNDTHDRKPQHFTCSSGMFFDSTTLSCRDRMNVRCPLDRCEGMGNKYVNVAGNCQKYALCRDGVTKTVGECPSNYYFDERTQGCTPQVVNYAACAA